MREISLLIGPIALCAAFVAYSPSETREDIHPATLVLSMAPVVMCFLALKRLGWRPMARFVVFVLLGLVVYFAAAYELLFREPAPVIALLGAGWTSAALGEVSTGDARETAADTDTRDSLWDS